MRAAPQATGNEQAVFIWWWAAGSISSPQVRYGIGSTWTGSWLSMRASANSVKNVPYLARNVVCSGVPSTPPSRMNGDLPGNHEWLVPR